MFNLIICYHALHDVEKLKETFQKLMFLEVETVDRLADSSEQDSEDIQRAIFHDNLRSYARQKLFVSTTAFYWWYRQERIEHIAVLAARLVAISDKTLSQAGFDWVIETIKNSPMSKLSNQLEILKALDFVVSGEFPKVISSFWYLAFWHVIRLSIY